MNLFLLIIIYFFAITGYLFSGVFLYITLDDIGFNRLHMFFHNMLTNIFYKSNKEDCEYYKDYLFYKHNLYTDTSLWRNNYNIYETILDLICLILWPLWILINLIIGAFYDD